MCGLSSHLSENIFQRWHAIQLAVTPTPSAQMDTSFNSPNPIEKAILPRRQDIPYVSNLTPTTKPTQTPTHLSLNLILSQHTLQEIHQVLITTPDSNTCSKVHICHPVLPITIKHLHTLQRTIHSEQYHNIFNRTLFYHLRITALSLLVPRDRLLYITIDNIIYALTSTGTTNVDTPHRLHLFLNPHNRMLYLQHTHEVDERTTRYLEITIIFPSTCSPSTRPRRRPIMRTTTHTLDLLMTLTFPAEFLQNQVSIVILLTRLFLSIPTITSRQSWDIVREGKSRQHTLQLIIDTITLKRYHKV